jgi:DNA-binding transcriptional MerR regulator
MRNPSVEEIPFHRRLLPARAVADRYGTHLRTISRWVARGVIPPPDEVINDRRYWLLETLDRADRRRTAEVAANRGANSSMTP